MVFCSFPLIQTENVDVDSGGGASAAVNSLDDVGGSVSSCGVSNGDLGVPRLGVNGNAVVGLEGHVSLGPLYTGIRFSSDISGKLNLGTGPNGQSCQQLHVQLNLRGFC